MSRQRPGTAAGAARTEWIDHWPTIDDVLNDMGHPVSGTGRNGRKQNARSTVTHMRPRQSTVT